MDSLTKYQHDKGTRAYLSFQGNKFLQDSDGNMWPVYSTDEESVKDWHALRAYQDAERKKGVPITLSHHGELRWFQRDYSNFNFLTTYSYEPYILCDKARFTNFRWRAGYPKGGQNG